MKVTSVKPVVDLTFWQKAYYYKLEELKLSEEEIPIFGTSKFSKFNENEIRLQFDGQSFEKQNFEIKFDTFFEIQVPGILKIINKKQEFEQHHENIQECYQNFQNKHKQTANFLLLLFIDHKKFEYQYNFYEIRFVDNFQALIEDIQLDQTLKVSLNLEDTSFSKGLTLNKQKVLFCDTTIGPVISKLVLNHISINFSEIEEFHLVKSPLILKEESIEQEMSLKTIKFKITKNKQILEKPKFRCKNKKIKINLKDFLNKETIIENQSQLNLKLMKWRLEPNLDLDMLSSQKVLILGTGTLGCNMARLLIGYGIKKITFLDNGKVSYSNLARQSLFNTENFDEHEKGIPKVEAARQNLLKVSPFADIKTLNMNMPMPGHFVQEDQLDPVLKDLEIIEKEIEEHDILLNCFDSREARYFPTLLGALYNKTVLSIGIGYDSFVAVNHGKYGKEFLEQIQKVENQKEIQDLGEKNKIGCFFCSDYLPPSDTISNRSLDQQCTVSRPGISMISSGVGLEMLINSLHDDKIGESPRFVRGVFGSQFEFNQYESSRYNNCTACSTLVIKEFLRDRKKFLLAVLNSPNLLNQFSGFNDVVGEVTEEDMDSIIILDGGFGENLNKENEQLFQ